jgi:hypothetical protein
VVETIIDGELDRFPVGVIQDHSGESTRIIFSPSYK